MPYKHKGRSIEEGLDCWGLITCIYGELGYGLFDINDYDVDWSAKGHDLLLGNYERQWEKVDLPLPLDVVLFSNDQCMVNHAGLVIGHGRFIHCHRPGVAVAHLGDPRWLEKRAGFYRFKHDTSTIPS